MICPHCKRDTKLSKEQYRKRIRAGIEHAIAAGVKFGRPPKVDPKVVKEMFAKGLSKSEIARRLKVTRRTVQVAVKRASS